MTAVIFGVEPAKGCQDGYLDVAAALQSQIEENQRLTLG